MELIFIALLALLLFGGKRMPELLRELGKLARTLQHARRELEEAVRREAAERTPDVGRPAEPAAPEVSPAPPPPEGGIPPEYAEHATLPPAEEPGTAAEAEPPAPGSARSGTV